MSDRERSPDDDRYDEETGSEPTKAPKKPGTGTGGADDSGESTPEEAVASTSVGLGDTEESVTEGVRPQADTTVSPGTVQPRSISLSRLTGESKIVDPVIPRAAVTRSEGTVVTTSVDLEQPRAAVQRRVQPNQRSTEREGVVTQSEIELEQQTESVLDPVNPSAQVMGEQAGNQVLLGELEEYDPVFGWGGGSPYGSDRPLFVVNRDPESFSTLEHLQGVLRDIYSELRGGEPGTAPVEFLANEFRAPPVQGKVVTLDLRDGGWKPAIQNGKPTIERSDHDLVPRLREVVETLYSGGLGYFVLNVPDEWGDSYLMEGFHERLVARLAGLSDSGRPSEEPAENESRDGERLFEAVESAPVVLATPRVETREGFIRRVAGYYGLDDETQDTFTSVRQVERVIDNVLTQNDWVRVRLTERHGEESNRHYLWKAAIVDGVCRAVWRADEDGSGERAYRTFVRETLLEEIEAGGFGIETEVEMGSSDLENPPRADIKIAPGGASDDWTTAVRTLFDGEEDEDPRDETAPTEFPVAIEYETGFSEGAFNFRKVVETLEKYENDDKIEHVAVVIPPRLLYRGQSRARLIESLVDQWTEHDGNPSATLYVPELVGGVIRRFVPAADRIERLYE
jgi:hypothetical protein